MQHPGYGSIGDDIDADGSAGDDSYIVMVQNSANAGEYKVFNLASTGTNTDFSAAQLIGSVDFGEDLTGTFDAANFA